MLKVYTIHSLLLLSDEALTVTLDIYFDRFIVEMSAQDCCIRCKEPVRARQEGLQCDGCERWQHRTCNSGISQIDYRTAVRCGQDIEWRCDDCLNMSAGFLLPVAESTRVVQEGKLLLYRLLITLIRFSMTV